MLIGAQVPGASMSRSSFSGHARAGMRQPRQRVDVWIAQPHSAVEHHAPL